MPRHIPIVVLGTAINIDEAVTQVFSKFHLSYFLIEHKIPRSIHAPLFVMSL